MKNEMRTCFTCLKYPLCRIFTKIEFIICNENIAQDTQPMMKALAKMCIFYKENFVETAARMQSMSQVENEPVKTEIKPEQQKVE